MEIETEQEGASLHIEEYQLLRSSFRRFFKSLISHCHINPNTFIFSLQKELLAVFQDIPKLHLSHLSQVIVESCFKINMNRTSTRVEMVLREHIVSDTAFFNTLFVNLKFLKLNSSFESEIGKNKYERPKSIHNCSKFGEESEDMIKFLAVIRKLGMDIIFPQDVHDKVLCCILYVMHKKVVSPHRDVIDIVMMLSAEGFLNPIRHNDGDATADNITKTKIRGVLSLLKNALILSTDQDKTPVSLLLSQRIKSFLDLRRLHDDFLIAHIKNSACTFKQPRAWCDVLWEHNEPFALNRYEQVAKFSKRVDSFYLSYTQKETLRSIDCDMMVDIDVGDKTLQLQSLDEGGGSTAGLTLESRSHATAPYGQDVQDFSSSTCLPARSRSSQSTISPMKERQYDSMRTRALGSNDGSSESDYRLDRVESSNKAVSTASQSHTRESFHKLLKHNESIKLADVSGSSSSYRNNNYYESRGMLPQNPSHDHRAHPSRPGPSECIATGYSTFNGGDAPYCRYMSSTDVSSASTRNSNCNNFTSASASMRGVNVAASPYNPVPSSLMYTSLKFSPAASNAGDNSVLFSPANYLEENKNIAHIQIRGEQMLELADANSFARISSEEKHYSPLFAECKMRPDFDKDVEHDIILTEPPFGLFEKERDNDLSAHEVMEGCHLSSMKSNNFYNSEIHCSLSVDLEGAVDKSKRRHFQENDFLAYIDNGNGNNNDFVNYTSNNSGGARDVDLLGEKCFEQILSVDFRELMSAFGNKDSISDASYVTMKASKLIVEGSRSMICDDEISQIGENFPPPPGFVTF